jgi:hypothetical protein
MASSRTVSNRTPDVAMGAMLSTMTSAPASVRRFRFPGLSAYPVLRGGGGAGDAADGVAGQDALGWVRVQLLGGGKDRVRPEAAYWPRAGRDPAWLYWWLYAGPGRSVFWLVETRGIEPLTPALQRRCSAN